MVVSNKKFILQPFPGKKMRHFFEQRNFLKLYADI